MKLSRKSAIRDEKIILTIVFSVFESKKAFKFCIFCLRNCEKILPKVATAAAAVICR